MSFFFSELIEICAGFTKFLLSLGHKQLIFGLHIWVLCELLLQHNEKYSTEEP